MRTHDFLFVFIVTLSRISLRKKIVHHGIDLEQPVVVDLSEARLVDHTVMDKLHALQQDFTAAGLSLEIGGLDSHIHLSSHELAARRRPKQQ